MGLNKMHEEIRKHASFFICFLIWLFSAVNEIYWLKLDKFPLTWDMSGHFVTSILLFRTLREGIFAAPHIFFINQNYPPLVTFMATPFYAIFNISPDIGVAGINLSFMAILISSTFYIGKKMMNQAAGIISAFIVSMFPIVFTYSRYFMLDFPLVSMVSLSLCILLFTENFSNRKYSILFGITLGLGMLTKWTFIIFIVGPLIYYLYMSYKLPKGSAIKSPKIFELGHKEAGQPEGIPKFNLNFLINFIISIISGFVVASSWYIPNMSVLDFLRTNAANDIGSPSYIIILICDMFPLFFILFIMLFFNLLRSGRPNSNMIFVLIWILVPLLVLSLQLNRQGRYIAPICPAFALFSGMGIEKIETKKLRTILIIFIIGFGLLEFFSNSYEVNILPKDAIKIGSDNISLFYYPEYNRPNVDDWKTEEIVATLLDYRDRDQKYTTISMIPENPMIYSPLGYYSVMRGLNFSVYSGGFDPIPLFQSEFVLTLKDRKGFWGLHNNSNERIDYFSLQMYKKVNYLQDLFEQHIDNFTLIKNFDLPPIWNTGKSELLIYKLKKRYQVFNGSSPVPKYRLTANFSDDVQFLGYDLNGIGNKSREIELYGKKLNTFQISYYWRCLRERDRNYTIYVHFLDDKGKTIFEQDHLPCYGAFQTSKWKKGDFIKEEYFIDVPDVQPGNYKIQIGLWSPPEKEMVSPEPNNINSFIIGNVTI